MDLPSTITSVADAQLLLAAVDDERGDTALGFFSPLAGLDHYRASSYVLHALQMDPRPGPAVSSSLHGPIGNPQPRSAGGYVVAEPEVTPYGVVLDERGRRYDIATKTLAQIVSDIGVVQACAARAARCADADRAADRPRAAARWQLEADALITYADQLEQQLIEPIAAHVLDELRAQLARSAGRQAAKHPSPTVRSVRLR